MYGAVIRISLFWVDMNDNHHTFISSNINKYLQIPLTKKSPIA
jgi:hypothetical protein